MATEVKASSEVKADVQVETSSDATQQTDDQLNLESQAIIGFS